jgi:nicotinamidase/pyrazinamidase
LPREPISAIVRKGQDRGIDSYSGFRDNLGPTNFRKETGLSGYLRTRGIQRVLICGLALDVCVAWTAFDAVKMDFQAVLLRDLARSVTAEGEHEVLATLNQAGVAVADSADLRQGG